MSESSEQSQHPTMAPLTNVALTLGAVRAAKDRRAGLPGILVLHGPSGWGKSTAAAYCQVQEQAYYISMLSLWSRRDFLLALAAEMGLEPAGSMAVLAGRIAEQLAKSRRPLIIDEADVLADRAHGADLIKDLYESTVGVILLVGEERLPAKLARHERLHGRVTQWIGAQPATEADARALARIYCPGVSVAPDLLRRLGESAKGSVRRIAVNLDNIHKEARQLGWDAVDLALWGDRAIYTGEAPARRVSA